MESTHVVAAAFSYVDVNDNIAGSLDVIVLVERRDHVLDHVAHEELAFVSGALLDFEERVNLWVIPLAVRHQVDPFLAGTLVTDNVIQELPGVFLVLDLRQASCKRILVRCLAHVSVIVRHFHRRLARHLVKRVRRIGHSLVQLRVKRSQLFSNWHHASKVEQAR